MAHDPRVDGEPPAWAMFVPKLVTCFREGYSLATLRADFVAGLTVAVVALPLAMAFAIASGTTPDRGLFTAVVAGFLISALGGSRHQIGGPTGAFVVIVFGVIQQHGYDGLVIATLMAGVMLVGAGLAGLGTVIKFVPYPVVTGFTAGIAVIIFSTQVKDLLGLDFPHTPGTFVETWQMVYATIATIKPWTMATAALALATILVLRRWRPRWPVMLIGVAAAALLAAALSLPVETIGSRFGGIPRSLPAPSLPVITFARLVELFPAAATIAFLAGIESLLSAVIADGMTGRHHRSNGELVAQGVANLAAAIFGGIPATGAIARTATNIRSGARTPLSGMLHAVFLLVFMWALAPLAAAIPLAALGGVLAVVAWNMAEVKSFRHIMRAPAGDRLVLLLTFGLTVLVDITVAIGVGVVVASLLFMRRMAQVTQHSSGIDLMPADRPDRPNDPARGFERDLPDGVQMYRIEGPLFFGVASHLNDVMERIGRPPKVFILRLGQVPFIDASGAHALEDFIDSCERRGTRIILSRLQDQPRAVLDGMGITARLGPDGIAADPDAALAVAARYLAGVKSP
jgi:SulP family sulfate permease